MASVNIRESISKRVKDEKWRIRRHCEGSSVKVLSNKNDEIRLTLRGLDIAIQFEQLHRLLKVAAANGIRQLAQHWLVRHDLKRFNAPHFELYSQLLSNVHAEQKRGAKGGYITVWSEGSEKVTDIMKDSSMSGNGVKVLKFATTSVCNKRNGFRATANEHNKTSQMQDIEILKMMQTLAERHYPLIPNCILCALN